MLGGSCSPCCQQFSCDYELPDSIEISWRGRDFFIAGGNILSGQRTYNYVEVGFGQIVVVLSNSSPFSPFFGSPGAFVNLYGEGTLEQFLELCNVQAQTLSHFVSAEMVNTGEGLFGLCNGSDGLPAVPLFSDVPVRQLIDFKSIPRQPPAEGFDVYQQQLAWNWPDAYAPGERARRSQQLNPGINMFPVRIRRTRSTGTFQPQGRTCLLLNFETTDRVYTGFPGITKAETILP